MQSNQEMTSFVVDLLKEKLSPFYYYHNYKHTLYVRDKVIEIGEQENCSANDIRLLEAAALWHDSGFINTTINHEKEGCKLAKQYLPEYGFSPAEIETICGMIMATKMPQSPRNKLEEIIADADLEYLGAFNVEAIAADLFREINHFNPYITKADWHRTQIAFLKTHQYFTHFCKENREPLKREYLWNLVNNIG